MNHSYKIAGTHNGQCALLWIGDGCNRTANARVKSQHLLHLSRWTLNITERARKRGEARSAMLSVVTNFTSRGCYRALKAPALCEFQDAAGWAATLPKAQCPPVAQFDNQSLHILEAAWLTQVDTGKSYISPSKCYLTLRYLTSRRGVNIPQVSSRSWGDRLGTPPYTSSCTLSRSHDRGLMSESRKSSKRNPHSQADLSNPGVDCAALGEFDNHAAMEAAFPIHLKKEMQCQHLMRPKPSCFVAERDVVGRKFLRGEIRKEGNAERITTFRCRTLLTSPKACRALGVATPSSSLLLLSNAAPGENHFKMEIVPSNQSTPSPESASRRRGEKLQLACRCVGGVTEPSISAATARACRCVGSDLGPPTAAVQAKIMIPSGGIKTRIGSAVV